MLNPLTNAFSDYPVTGLMKTDWFARNHTQLLTIRSKITTTSLLAAKNRFFIAASPKLVAKIRFQSGKYSLLLARICNPCQYIIQPQCSNPDNWKWHRPQTSVSKSNDDHSLSKQKSMKKRQTSDKARQHHLPLHS